MTAAWWARPSRQAALRWGPWCGRHGVSVVPKSRSRARSRSLNGWPWPCMRLLLQSTVRYQGRRTLMRSCEEALSPKMAFVCLFLLRGCTLTVGGLSHRHRQCPCMLLSCRQASVKLNSGGCCYNLLYSTRLRQAHALAGEEALLPKWPSCSFLWCAIALDRPCHLPAT